MKKLILPFVLLLIASISSAQNDTIKARPVQPIKIKPQIVQKQFDSQLTRLDNMLTKLETDLKNLNAEIDKLKDSKDSLSEQSEQQQLKMQMIMDRMTKADAAASNMLKKFSEVASQIISNMK